MANTNSRSKSAQNKTLSYQRYSTNPADFQTWLDKIYSKLNSSVPVATILIGVSVFFLGLLFAATFDFGKEYVNTSAIYIGVLGICLVSGVVRYASLKIHGVFEYLRPCFLVENNSYLSFVNRWFSRLSNNGNLVVAGVYIVLALLLAYAEFHTSLMGRVQYGATKAYFFNSFWYQPENLSGKTFLIAFYGICVALPLGTATRLLFLNYVFMRELAKLPVVPLIQTIRLRFRELIDYYLFIYFTWSIGIGLFGVVFFNGLKIDSILFLSVLNALGIGAFISPQLCYRSFVSQEMKFRTNQSLKKFYANFRISLAERPIAAVGNSKSVELKGISETSGESINWWVYNLSDILLFILAQIIVYGATFLQ
jgi:hypothetical protein